MIHPAGFTHVLPCLHDFISSTFKFGIYFGTSASETRSIDSQSEVFTTIFNRKSLSTIRGPPLIKGPPVFDICRQKYCHKIKYETSHISADGSRLTTSRAVILQRGEEQPGVEKCSDKRVELARHGIHSHRTRSHWLRSQ
ncbi:hypothetical protein JTE90_027501 [Oedothorax gibbosus]|uniref:Uncharacterized protein n=1 Tax=Oedothorax gibbosus TaxID=931172 RepID=A0AAV6TDD4_9ARAC|nr:hypothetical protein JTE90_027501 [Oedothorax gibbosus]